MSSRMDPNELPSYFHYYNILFSQNEIIPDGFYIHMKGTGNDYISKLKAPGKRLKSLIETHQHLPWI